VRRVDFGSPMVANLHRNIGNCGQNETMERRMAIQRYNVAGDATATKTKTASFRVRLDREREINADMRSA